MLGQLSVVFADLAVISAIALAVIYYSPFGALALVLCITLWMGSQHLLIGPAVHHVGVLTAELQATATGAVEDAIGIHSEAGVMGREAGIERSLMTVRRELAQNSSREYYFTQVPRFSIEVGLLLTLGITGMTVVLTQSATSAAASLAVILAGVTRILPSIVRLQNSTLLLRSIQGAAETAVTLEKAFEGSSERSGDSRGTPDAEHPPAEIVIHDLSFAWPNSATPLFQHVQLRIAAGSRVAIIGPSGAGKSTLCDLILGFRSPTEGQILINGQLPRSYLHKLPGAVGYVPQSVWLVRGSIRSNVALGIPNEEIDGHRVSTALRKAGLTDVVCAAPDGIETVVGTGGLRLSGGQVQRLGIARALYASPSLLVMDEPSSALDAESENDLAIVLDGLLGSVTVLVVAHRPRLMEAADLVVSVSAGEVTTRLGTISAR